MTPLAAILGSNKNAEHCLVNFYPSSSIRLLEFVFFPCMLIPQLSSNHQQYITVFQPICQVKITEAGGEFKPKKWWTCWWLPVFQVVLLAVLYMSFTWESLHKPLWTKHPHKQSWCRIFKTGVRPIFDDLIKYWLNQLANISIGQLICWPIILLFKTHNIHTNFPNISY